MVHGVNRTSPNCVRTAGVYCYRLHAGQLSEVPGNWNSLMTLNWVLIIWSMAASASLTLAAIHFLVWFKNRTAWANLLFSLAAMAAVATAGCELWLMRAATPAEFGATLRWFQVAVWAVVLPMTGFVLLYLRAGRLWLVWTICVLRTFSLALNFLVGQNLNYLEITGLRHIRFLGESVT